MIYIKRQLRFALEDVLDNKMYFLIGFVQVTIASIIICYVLSLVSTSIVSMEKINHLKNVSSIYGINDTSSGQQFERLINEKQGLMELQKLYGELSDTKDLKRIIINGSQDISIGYEQLQNQKMIKIGKSARDNDVSFETLRVTPEFFGFFKVELEGNAKDPFSQGYNCVVMGSDFKPFYDIGDTFTDITGTNYVAVGFLKKNSYYMSPFENKNAVNLENFIIMPWKVDYNDSVSILCHLKNGFYIDKKGELETTIERANLSEIISFKQVSLENQLNQCVIDIENELITMITIGVLILIFASVGIMSYFGQHIERRTKEFAINMICGGEKKDILIRIVIQIGIIIFLAIIISNGMFGFSRHSILSDLLLVLYGIIITFCLSVKIKKTSIIQMVRRGEA